ncbi:CGNR zinc finger domain-containing protein [Streptomyces sp. NPDC059837]|nr:CGNR zinc finger domain-containing protein [Streptomyces sp. NBC_00268]
MALRRTNPARRTYRSLNNSGVWHDVRTCGNVANLRAFRQRRRKNA